MVTVQKDSVNERYGRDSTLSRGIATEAVVSRKGASTTGIKWFMRKLRFFFSSPQPRITWRGERSWKQRTEPVRTKPTSHWSGTSTLRLVGEKAGARREYLPSGA